MLNKFFTPSSKNRKFQMIPLDVIYIRPVNCLVFFSFFSSHFSFLPNCSIIADLCILLYTVAGKGGGEFQGAPKVVSVLDPYCLYFFII